MPELTDKKLQLPKKSYAPTGKEEKLVKRLQKRINQLQEHRKNISGLDLNKLWREADDEYVPKEFSDGDLKEWQSKQKGSLVYEKINTALAVIVDQNPEVTLKAGNKSYQKKNNFMRGLYDYSWAFKNNGPKTIRLFTHNLAKYGFSIGRNYHRYEERIVQDLVRYDPSTNNSEYEKRKIIDFNDPWSEVLNPHDAWVDDMATPVKDARDWCWRKVMSWEDFRFTYSKERFRNTDKVSPGGKTQPENMDTEDVKPTEQLIEVLFYENSQTDEFHILANGVLLTNVVSPLPYDHKRLSCFYTHWSLRNTNTIYGIGLPEVMRGDNNLIDTIMNMSMDQLILSIYKMFFYSPANDFSEDQYEIEPMKGIPTNDPKAIQFMEIPGPGKDVPEWLSVLGQRIDDSTGISKTIGGQSLGKTAFEARQNLEAGLRRLKTPLKNIEDAFEVEGNLRLDMIQQIYSVPRALRIIDPEDYEAFKQDRADNPNLYFEEDGNVKRIDFKTVTVPFQRGQTGEIEPSENDETLELSPDMIRYEGELTIKPMSTLVKSPELEAEKAMRMFNLIAQNPITDIQKSTERLLIKNDERPKDWLRSQESLDQEMQQAEQSRDLGFGQEEGAPPSKGASSTTGPAPRITKDQNLDFNNSTPGALSQVFS